MGIHDDISFWHHRAEQARAMADRAITPAIRQIHLDRVDLYTAQVRDREQTINRPYIRSA